MADTGQRVRTMKGCVRPDGSPAPENVAGFVVGHMGEWDLIHPDGDEEMILCKPQDDRLIRQPGEKPSRSRPRR